MIKADKYYIDNLLKIKYNGSWDKNPRAKYLDGTPAHSKFITQVFEEYDISKNEFPITTLRNTAIKTGIKEMLWIYQQQDNLLETAHGLGINWWDEWDIGDGTIGQRYGATIRRYRLIDKLIHELKNYPYSRRHIINMYQEYDLSETKGLFPCAYETLWSVREYDNEHYLDLTLVQRSNDYLVSGYINKIQYVALMMMIAHVVGYKVGKFCHLTQNLHIYDRHLLAMEEVLNKTPINVQPEITLKPKKDFYEYEVSDFNVYNTENIVKIYNSLEIAI